MKTPQAQQVDGVFHRIELGSIRWHQTKLYTYCRWWLFRPKLCQERLHFFFVRGVAVKKNVHAHNALFMMLLNQVGKVRGNIFGLGRSGRLKKELCTAQVYGK